MQVKGSCTSDLKKRSVSNGFAAKAGNRSSMINHCPHRLIIMQASSSKSVLEAKSGRERRAYRRVRIEQFCRMIYRGREYPCEVIDVSEGGTALKTPVIPEVGESLILYFDDMGRVRGQVVRRIEGGCAIAFSTTQIKRNRVVQRLDLLVKNGRTQSLPHERLLLELLAAGNGIELTDIREGSILKQTLEDARKAGWIEWTSDAGRHRISITERGRLLGPLAK